MLIQRLTDSVFTKAINPHKVVVNEKAKLIVFSNYCLLQYPARLMGRASHFLLVYHSETFELIAELKDLKFPVNEISFHPEKSLLVVGIGRYDGGAFFEGELLVWNWRTGETFSMLSSNREVVQCSFNEKGDKLIFTLNPPDDLEEYDYKFEKYESDFSLIGKIDLNTLKPELIFENPEEENPDNWRTQFQKGIETLSALASTLGKEYVNRAMVWDLVFINETTLAAARNDAIVEIFNLQTGERKVIRLLETGTCVEIFYNSHSNSLLVNWWSEDFRMENPNKLFSISLEDFTCVELMECGHTLSQSEGNYFLGRKYSDAAKDQQDFILNPDYKIIFKSPMGSYDSYNHFIRLDNDKLLYFVAGEPKNSHKNKSLWAIDPGTLKFIFILKLEEPEMHFNQLCGMISDKFLVVAGKVYSSNRSRYNEVELFGVDLTDSKMKWLRKVNSPVAKFALLSKGEKVVAAYINGQLEVIDVKTGNSELLINRENFSAGEIPLSTSTFGNLLAVGLANGEIEIFRF